MELKRYISFIIIVAACVIPFFQAGGQTLNDKLLNRPYTDMRKWHLGFGVGIHAQDIQFTHNGYVTDNGETWFMDQPDFSPGFNVNGLFDLRLNNYFNLRVSPGMYFGNRVVKMVNTSGDNHEQQNIKTAYVVLPFDVKYSALRYRNARPYLVGGLMPAFDVTKKRNDILKLKPTDFFFTIGFGCDFYLPYFKLIPELKFCFGLTDVIDRNRPDLADNPEMLKFTNSLKKATSSMVVLTFYFE